jgi:hypothetical protein
VFIYLLNNTDCGERTPKWNAAPADTLFAGRDGHNRDHKRTSVVPAKAEIHIGVGTTLAEIPAFAALLQKS